VATQALPVQSRALSVELVATFTSMRALAWRDEVLYASRGYELYSARIADAKINWERIAAYRPQWWRNVTCRIRLASRLVRDGFHALACLRNGNLIAAVPGAITTLRSGETEFITSHRLLRGTRSLHFATTPDGRAFWGEYFDNAERDEVHIYMSSDGCKWDVAHTFEKGSIRHVHNVIYDKWRNCLWILTGDYGRECRILRASPDFKTVDEITAGNQQARAVAAIPAKEGLYFASDTPIEQNYIYRLDRHGNIHRLWELPSSSIYGCRNQSAMFFSTMIEPSRINLGRNVTIFGSGDGAAWQSLAAWKKDYWAMKFFQYGNAFLPDGDNASDFLAATTIAVQGADLQMSIWRTTCEFRS
jgi:hypothetical protein